MPTLKETLYALAEPNGGYLTASQAKAAGVGGQLLVNAAEQGVLERVSHGVYRYKLFPLPEHPDLHEAVLWPQVRREVAVAISHESALALLGMSEVSPSGIDLTIPPEIRIRRAPPRRLRLHRAPLAPGDVIIHAGLPVTAPARSLRDAAATGLSPSLVRQAIIDGNREGHLTVAEAYRLAHDLLGETVLVNEQGVVTLVLSVTGGMG